jgi:hypothetical protein
VLANTTHLTGVSIKFITRKRKTLHDMTECGGARMSQASMSEIDAGGKSVRCSVRGGSQLDGIEIARTLTAVRNHPNTGILYSLELNGKLVKPMSEMGRPAPLPTMKREEVEVGEEVERLPG